MLSKLVKLRIASNKALRNIRTAEATATAEKAVFATAHRFLGDTAHPKPFELAPVDFPVYMKDVMTAAAKQGVPTMLSFACALENANKGMVAHPPSADRYRSRIVRTGKY